jgi:dipeptidyl aminopeptidase/acylaminoacyl peptidase
MTASCRKRSRSARARSASAWRSARDNETCSSRATFLFTEYKALDAYALGRRQIEVIATRDGLELPADLYLPKTADPDGNGRPRRPLPLLIAVHGGPWVAYPWNDWNTNRMLQLLADRGYAALRVEFVVEIRVISGRSAA